VWSDCIVTLPKKKGKKKGKKEKKKNKNRNLSSTNPAEIAKITKSLQD
jgi:hypothetical protein